LIDVNRKCPVPQSNRKLVSSLEIIVGNYASSSSTATPPYFHSETVAASCTIIAIVRIILNRMNRMKDLLSSFHLNGHMIELYPQTEKLQPPFTA